MRVAEAVMARLSDQAEPGVMERVFSPDRRIAIDFLPFPDPRSEYEAQAPETAVLRDAETGATLASFAAWTMVLRHDWPAEGGAVLTLPHERSLRIAPDLASFTPDDGPPQPIGALPGWLGTLAPALWTPVPPLSPAARIGWAAMALGAVVLVSWALFALLGD